MLTFKQKRAIHTNALPKQIDQWWRLSTSLTKALKQHYSCFSVEVLFEGIHQSEWERVVLLHGDNMPIVFAVSLLPCKWLNHPLWRRVRHLKNKPLGETLFASHLVRRQIISYFHLGKRVGRWSRFEYRKTYLDLVEIFL